jgi:hypothetical protein
MSLMAKCSFCGTTHVYGGSLCLLCTKRADIGQIPIICLGCMKAGKDHVRWYASNDLLMAESVTSFETLKSSCRVAAFARISCELCEGEKS